MNRAPTELRSTTTMSTLTRTPSVATLVSVVLLVAACGGGGGAASPTSSSGSTTQGQLGGAGDAGRARFPGVSGLVAAVEGSTLQVQGDNTQTAVSYTPTTTFTSQVAAVAADVVVGACVMVRSEGATGTPPSGASSGASSSPTQPLAAGSVTISPPVDGECTGGFGRGGAGGLPGGAGPGALPGGPPSGAPSGARTGRPTDGAIGGRPGGFGGAFGKVTAVSAHGFTVTSTVIERPAAAGTASPGSSPTAQTRVVTVATTARTTFTKTVPSTAKAAAVGTCVTAEGKADDTGALAATSVAVHPAENGSCSLGFPRGAAPAGATNG
jgi:hypothetical protein